MIPLIKVSLLNSPIKTHIYDKIQTILKIQYSEEIYQI